MTFKEAIIYRIDFPNKKSYIGRWTKSLELLKKRYSIKEKNKNRTVNNAIKKYGFDSIQFIVLETLSNCTNEELNRLEIFYIKEYKSLTIENGYNISSGGGCYDNFTNNPNRELIRNNMKLRLAINHPMKNRHHTDETKIKLGHLLKERIANGQLPPMKNKFHTNESKEKIRIALKGKYVGENNKLTTLSIDKDILDKLIFSNKTVREIMLEYKISQRILYRFLEKYYGENSLSKIRENFMTNYKFTKMEFEMLFSQIENISGRKICIALNIGRLTMNSFILKEYGAKNIMDVIERFKYNS